MNSLQNRVALVGGASQGLGAACAHALAEAGVANWAKTLSRELGQWGITVNNVLTGFTKTERLDYLFKNRAEKAGVSKEEILKNIENSIPVKRLGEPAEIAAAVCFLCSDAAGFINGINLPIDGGQARSL